MQVFVEGLPELFAPFGSLCLVKAELLCAQDDRWVLLTHGNSHGDDDGDDDDDNTFYGSYRELCPSHATVLRWGGGNEG